MQLIGHDAMHYDSRGQEAGEKLTIPRLRVRSRSKGQVSVRVLGLDEGKGKQDPMEFTRARCILLLRIIINDSFVIVRDRWISG